MLKIDTPFKYLLKSTLIVVLISAMCSFGGFLFGLNFYCIFFIVFSLQYILFFSISQITKSAFVEKTKLIHAPRIGKKVREEILRYLEEKVYNEIEPH